MNRAAGAPCLTDQATGMASSVIAEIGRLLQHLAETGETGAIDLRSLPLTEADRAQIEQWLGHGAIHVEMDLIGRSEIWETAYAGAWWIRHRGADDRVSSEEIAICPLPDILPTPAEDIRAAATRIQGDVEARPLPVGAPDDPENTTQEASHA